MKVYLILLFPILLIPLAQACIATDQSRAEEIVARYNVAYGTNVKLVRDNDVFSKYAESWNRFIESFGYPPLPTERFASFRCSTRYGCGEMVIVIREDFEKVPSYEYYLCLEFQGLLSEELYLSWDFGIWASAIIRC